MAMQDYFGAKDTFDTGSGKAVIFRLSALGATWLQPDPPALLHSHSAWKRRCARPTASRSPKRPSKPSPTGDPRSAGKLEIPFKPARVVLQDFTGVPSVVDLAALRNAMARMGGDPKKVNPLVPVDLVVDHSVQVDQFGSVLALFYNAEREFERNRERYEFLKWGQEAFDNFRVVPPATGIVHQVNLEYLAQVVQLRTVNGDGLPVAYPDIAGGHRQPHDHDQRPGRAGLGRGRHRGRVGHAGPAHVLPAARGRRLQAHRRAAGRRHRHRPGARASPRCCARRAWWRSSWSSTAPG